jgi:hypothetical protein
VGNLRAPTVPEGEISIPNQNSTLERHLTVSLSPSFAKYSNLKMASFASIEEEDK